MKVIQSILLFLLPLSIFSQYAPLENLDLETGEYYILAMFSESDPNSLRDSLGEFYIKDIQVLKELKELWKFDQEAPLYACGYHYKILICRNGKSIDNFYINLNCNTLCNNGNCYNFDNNKLRMLFGKTKTFFTEHKSCSIKEGREYLKYIQGDSNLIYAPNPLWMKYEGYFEFTYTYPNGTEAYYPEYEEKIDLSLLKYTKDTVFATLSKQIMETYPNENFELKDYGGSITEIIMRVTSNKSLERKFNLYERVRYNKWEYFKPSFITYWTTINRLENSTLIQNNKKDSIIKNQSTISKTNYYFSIGLISITIILFGIIIIKAHTNNS